MPIVNGIITAGPRLSADIAAAVGVTNTNISYLLGNIHGKARWWAKFKDNGRWPHTFVRSGTNGENFILQSGKAYWQDQFGWCGLTPHTFQNYSDAVNCCNGGVNGWLYVAPTGGENSPYHQAAMIGYKNAPRTHEGIGWVTLQGTSMTEGDTGVALIFTKTLSETYDLGYSDFAFLQSCRFGAYLKKISSAAGASAGTSAMRVIAQGTVLGGTDFVTLSGVYRRPVEDTFLGTEQDGTSQQLTGGTWEIYPFLFSEGTHYSIPYANKLTLTVGVKSQGVTITVTVSFSGLRANWTVTVRNNTSGAITLNNNSIQFRKPGASASTGMTAEEESQSLTIGSLASGASKTITGTSYIASDLKMSYGSCDVYVTLGGGAYTQWSRGWA